MRDMVTLEAPAKINLYLEVGARREDGYHGVRTVMQAVDLCDRVEVEVVGGRGTVALEVKGEAPAGEDNLCHRAARAFLEAAGVRWDVRMRLEKRIPLAAGLGGGSSDAAAVLRGLNFLAGEALAGEELLRLAASLGTDVPFFLVGGTALGEGRGERVTPLVQAPPLPLVLANPGVPLPTPEVYRRFDEVGGGEPPRGGVEAMGEALRGGEVRRVASLLFNSLQPAACALMPQVGALLEHALWAGAEGALVSGSGPTVFALAGDEGRAAEMEAELRRHAPVVVRTRFRAAGISLA
ncbi:MAG: 4-(cytidine 5'-diphospho)-2-C-methyl-D-erythritol kinase [Actinobacteria bacterium]|nr:4-(cytidine 5'-diphospho)-2-C-methyl-D-erythritol kinase [Actinomycetota bacterium]MDI6830666.1 4-(cytidine 5'-diphospho)-2-C-methyl-D-erythritol kinase [Actinomycetota bacterium]